MAEEKLNTPTPDISTLFGELLANKELMNMIGEITGKAQSQDNEKQPAAQSPSLDSLLSKSDVMSKLPEVIGVITPLLSSNSAGSHSSNTRDTDKRLALLMALKPYLSSKRCEAIDYIAKMSKLSQTVKDLNF